MNQVYSSSSDDFQSGAGGRGKTYRIRDGGDTRPCQLNGRNMKKHSANSWPQLELKVSMCRVCMLYMHCICVRSFKIDYNDQ